MTFAVAGGGRVSASFIARIPRLSDKVGPVAAQSYRLASRIVNSLGAGRAVRSFADLNDSELILICAPNASVAVIVSALAGSIDCREKTILLCDDGADSGCLSALRVGGASVGSLQAIPGTDGKRYVGEGDPRAFRKAKQLVQSVGGRLDEVQADKMRLYGAAISFGTSLVTPLMEASLQCLLGAGMPKKSAVKVVEAIFQTSTRAYAYTGKRSWTGPLARADFAVVQREIDALAASKPLLAEHYRQMVELSLRLLGPSPEIAPKTRG